jgi:hypothetical protein
MRNFQLEYLSDMKGSEILGMFRVHVNECSVKVTVDERNSGSVILFGMPHPKCSS